MLTALELEALRLAKASLEKPRFFARVANLIGTPLERGAAMLPESVRFGIATLTERAVEQALSWSVVTLGSSSAQPQNRLHRALAALTGGLGGIVGLPALALELPFSTMLILRSVAEIGRSFGEDLTSTEARLACVQVFALGGFNKSDDAADAGYYATRTALALTVADAARYLTERGAMDKSAPALVRAVSAIAARFGVVVSDKVMLAALPLVSAATGAALNVAFMDHFQRIAEGHFTVRALERQHGAAIVHEAYERV